MNNQNSQHNGRNGQRSRLSRVEPWASYLGGGALTALGISRKSLGGAAIAAAGGFLIYRAAQQRRGPQQVHVQKTFTIMKQVNEVYSFWHKFENLPHIMTHLENVRSIDNRYSHWKARGPMNMSIEWDAEIIDERENEFIVWRSCAGSDIENRGSVQFFSALNGEATEISVAIDYDPPAGKAGALFARVFGEDPEQQVREDLRAFKALMEAGEVPTIEGQPHGRRSALVRAAKIAYPGSKKKSQGASQQRRPLESLA
ncbi:MAG TPA: SRPBCC family protein [Candidatus Koribacter sp.]|jgi:uncharacterized membrane protein